LSDKHYLITGATDGIGRATADALAKGSATVVLVGRNPDKLNRVVEAIKAETYNKNVYGLVADLSSQSQIRQLAKDYRAQFSRLDVLINNAGGYFYDRQETVDGIELTFALNHLAYFMLTGLLLDMLIATGQETGDARIVSVSSEAHRFKRDSIPFDDLQTTKKYNAMKAYSLSKIGNIMFTYELARRLKGYPVTANALHPGFVRTGFTRNAHGFSQKIFAMIARFLASSPKDGAKTSLYLATSDEVRDVSGKYFAKSNIEESNDVSLDTDAQQQLWQASLEMTGIDDFPIKAT